ncbi:MAG: hypothetical protein ACE5ES_00125 [Candidatus Nanoarchaeia archaeon]
MLIRFEMFCNQCQTFKKVEKGKEVFPVSKHIFRCYECGTICGTMEILNTI